MGSKQTNLDPGLLKILLDSEINNFSIMELRDIYAERIGLGSCSNRSDLRKWLYRRLSHLVRKGLLVLSQPDNGEKALYRKSDNFLSEFRSAQSETPLPVLSLETTRDKSFLTTLRTRLSQYQVDMLACTGECTEYQQIVEEFPQLKDSVEPMYRRARERSSELLGKLRAINNLLQRSSS